MIPKVSPDNHVIERTIIQDEKVNGHIKTYSSQTLPQSEDISTESMKSTFCKGQEEVKSLRVLEALAASGLRALRYAREVDGIVQVVALDNDNASIEACKRNIEFNGSGVCSKVEAHLADARVYMLTHQKEFDVELHDIPLFVSLHSLCATLKCNSPSTVVFCSAVINAGYRISGSHVDPLALKSDAPMEVIWDIMRCWIQSHPVKMQSPDQSGTSILSKEPTLQANFAHAVASLSEAQAKKIPRFLPNPERHWGPKVRAGRKITSKHASLFSPEVLDSMTQEGNENAQLMAPAPVAKDL